MKLKKEGFTLIELLAVIVILAIIALIAVPIVLNIIDDTKSSATIRSVELYIHGVEMQILNNQLDEELGTVDRDFDGDYIISNNGKTLTKDENTVLNLEYDGEGIEEGILRIENGKVVKFIDAKISGYYVKIINQEIKLYKTLQVSKLESGKTFVATIKTLVNDSNKTYNESDTAIKSIHFYPEEQFPDGYTYESLNILANVDVSEKQDESIIAYYDGNGNVYVYSKNAIQMNEDSSYMFYGLKSLTYINFNELDTSVSTKMNYMFADCTSLTILDVSSFDTSKVTSMVSMFSNCTSLTNLDLSNFDTSKVTNMAYMFYKTSLNSLDLSNFNTSEVTNMNGMFSNCASLTSLNVNNFDTSKVTSISGMFINCTSLKNLDLSNFNTSKVTNMQSMFMNCISLTNLDVSNFDTSKVTNMSGMFYNCAKLSNLNLSSFDTSKVTNMDSMFSYCYVLKNLDFSKANFSQVKLYDNMFYYVPDTCEIKVKDAIEQSWIQDNFSNLTNVNISEVKEN